MPTSTREILLGRYHYDPLDRLVDCTPFEQAAIQRYYCKKRLAPELQGAVQRTIVQYDDQLLAQQQREGGKMAAALLATDQQRSVLSVLDATQPHPLAYTAYGHRPMKNGLRSLLGFNGERPDPMTGHYHLGSGYRQYNPVLMRFNSPDSWSPFGEGGLNAYGYCGGDSINRSDPSGHFWGIGKFFRWLFRRGPKATKNSNPVSKTVARSSSEVSMPSGVPTPSPLSSTQTVTHLTPADYSVIDLDYALFEPAKNTASRVRVQYLNDPGERLANLKSARINVSKRLASDPPGDRERRLFLLNNIDSDISELTKQVNQIRNPRSPISI